MTDFGVFGSPERHLLTLTPGNRLVSSRVPVESAAGFILGSNARPAPETSRTSETQESLCPNIFRP